MRRCLLLAVSALMTIQASAQSLKKPDVPDPSLLKIKQSKGHYNGAGYMGLFDANFSLGYIDKSAHVPAAPVYPADLSTSGQYAMFHLQEGVLSNYFLAKSYKRDKRFKFGIQNTFDLGFMRGSATGDSSNYATTKGTVDGYLDFFFNYQFGLAGVLKINSSIDIGYTFYPYVKSIFHPESKSYSKLRMRYSRIMAEYSFGPNKCLELKYLRGKKVYFGLSYTENRLNRSDYSAITSSNINTSLKTNWIQLSFGRVF